MLIFHLTQINYLNLKPPINYYSILFGRKLSIFAVPITLDQSDQGIHVLPAHEIICTQAYCPEFKFPQIVAKPQG